MSVRGTLLRRLAAVAVAGAALVLPGASVTARGTSDSSAGRPESAGGAFGDEQVPPEIADEELAIVLDQLGQLELDLQDGWFGPTRPDDETRIADLRAHAQQLLDQSTVTWDELDRLWSDFDALLTDLIDRAAAAGALPRPGATAPPVPGNAGAPSGEPETSVRPPGGQQPTPAIRMIALAVYREAAVLQALDGFSDDTSTIDELVGQVGATGLTGDETRDELLDLLDERDRAAARSLELVVSVDPRPGPDAVMTVSLLALTEIEALAGGEAPLLAERYVAAIDALLFRDGRPLVDGSGPGAPVADLVRELGALVQLELTVTANAGTITDTGTITDAGTETPTDAAADVTAGDDAEPAGTGDSGDGPGDTTPWLTWLLTGTGALLVGAGLAWWLVRRRRRPGETTGRAAFQDLLDVSRRLASASTRDDVESTAVTQAMLLVGAEAGAFVRRDGRLLRLGFESADGLLVPERLGEGGLDRVLSGGQDLMQVSATEPAIRSLPVSMLATPVFADGAVVGAIVLVRDPERPFCEPERQFVADMRPIVGAAIESARHAERMKAEALIDSLTGIQNRRSLDRSLDNVGDDVAFAAVMIDLDHFKSVNDSLGHRAGDDLLCLVAERLLASVRAGDEVYRYGGEEFVIVLPDTDEATAVAVAERARQVIASSPFTIGADGVEHVLTASFGVAAGHGADNVFSRADLALYSAKHSGRDRVCAATDAGFPTPASGVGNQAGPSSSPDISSVASGPFRG